MDNVQSKKRFDLEDRTLRFARDVRAFVTRLTRTMANSEDSRQLIRSSGSVGANYIEANESLGQKDFLMRIKISRKEAKESFYWLELIQTASQEVEAERLRLADEARQLMMIFSAIMRKSK